jgi:YVTN family beta-propeller protein
MLKQFPFVLFFIVLPAAILLSAAVGPVQNAALDRSPTDLALTPDGAWAVSANSTSNTVSLVNLSKGEVVKEIVVGNRPFCIALSEDGKRGAVTNWLSNTVTLLRIEPPTISILGTLEVGEEPRGITFSPDGTRIFVALAGDDSICAIDTQRLRVTIRMEVGIEPWHLAVSKNSRTLAVCNVRSQDVSVIDIPSWKTLHSVKVRGHNLRHISISSDGEWAYLPNIAERGRPTTKDDIDRGWVIGNRLSRVPLKEDGPREAIAMDTRGKAEGDLDGLALSPDGKSIAITAGGTHELLLLRFPLPFVSFGGPEDHIDIDLRNDAKRFRRIPLGGRPLGAKFTPDGKSIVVANYLQNEIQVVDFDLGAVTKTIPLGSAAEKSLARKGEAIFYDADRSFNHWYSCSSCHSEGHTNGSNFDTFNDGSYETPKKTLSLRGVGQTAPYTWHGWQPDLRKLVHESMTKSMQGPEPTDADLDALIAFLKTLEFRPGRKAADQTTVSRGKEIFVSRACGDCHAPPTYSSPAVFNVGLEAPNDAYKGFNPPSLRGVAARSPFLHDGRTFSLTDVLTRYHRPSQLNGKADLSESEVKDLISFLRSL